MPASEKPSITPHNPSITNGRRATACNLLLLAVLILSLCSCASLSPMHFEPADLRTVNVLIGTDGTHDENEIMGLFQQFNGESVMETGIILNVVDIVPFDMNEQHKIWPACADYAYLSGIPNDIAIAFIPNTPIINFLVGGALGMCDTTVYRYIALKTTDYRVFKHEVIHVFHPGHSMSGLMFPIESFVGIPTGGFGLSEASREEVLRNKWRVFSGITVEQVEEMKRTP